MSKSAATLESEARRSAQGLWHVCASGAVILNRHCTELIYVCYLTVRSFTDPSSLIAARFPWPFTFASWCESCLKLFPVASDQKPTVKTVSSILAASDGPMPWIEPQRSTYSFNPSTQSSSLQSFG